MATGSVRTQPRRRRPGSPTHPLDLDIGEIADGYHLIARSISLSAKYLLFQFAFDPERAEGTQVWLNMCYGADLPVSQDSIGAGAFDLKTGQAQLGK